MTDGGIEAKFRLQGSDLIAAKRADEILERLWALEDIRDVSELPPAFVI